VSINYLLPSSKVIITREAERINGNKDLLHGFISVVRKEEAAVNSGFSDLLFLRAD